MSPEPEEARQHLALALDVGEAGAALELAGELSPYFAVAKVGLELFVAAGPPVVSALLSEGFDLFLDLKLHDIPSTVARAAARAAALGVTYLTAHTAGGAAMLEAAVAGFSSESGRQRAGILGVTVLTSEGEAARELLSARAALAASCGCVGLVCAGPDLGALPPSAGGLVKVVPGVRLAGSESHDQGRVTTPGDAIAAGGDILVIGRTVTKALDRRGAAAEVVAAVAGNSPRSG